jgi:hypothetical protein
VRSVRLVLGDEVVLGARRCTPFLHRGQRVDALDVR